jgi:hypothetical protein
VGYSLSTHTEADAFDSTSTVSIVADLGDAWAIETESSGTPGYVVGLTVEKLGGAVTSAVIGKPGQRGQSVEVLAHAGGDTPPVEGVAEEVMIGIGTFPALKSIEDYGTTWRGTEPELEGIVLKYASGSGSYELAELPDRSQVGIGEVQVDVTKLAYSDERQEWRSRHPVVACLRPLEPGLGIVLRSSESSTMSVTEIRTDAKPKLRWE